MSYDIISQRRLRRRIGQMILSMKLERRERRQAWEEKIEQLKRDHEDFEYIAIEMIQKLEVPMMYYEDTC